MPFPRSHATARRHDVASLSWIASSGASMVQTTPCGRQSMRTSPCSSAARPRSIMREPKPRAAGPANRRAARLLPAQAEAAVVGGPLHRHPAALGRQRAVLQRVGAELVQRHRQRDRALGRSRRSSPAKLTRSRAARSEARATEARLVLFQLSSVSRLCTALSVQQPLLEGGARGGTRRPSRSGSRSTARSPACSSPGD